MGLLSTHGELVLGRCKATNQCDYCAKLGAYENAEMLALDAAAGEAPEVWAVVGTRTATLDMSLFYAARKELLRVLRRDWPCQYASLLEFTTGYGPRAGGERRPHWNLLLKGIPAAELGWAADIILREWCDHVDAVPEAQHVGLVTDMGGLMGYVALHFQKESQTPPAGFRGQRFNCSREYFGDRTRAEMREDARLSLRDRRDIYTALRLGLEGDAAEDWLEQRYAAEGLPEWGIYYRAG